MLKHKLEDLAQNIADSINNEDSEKYLSIMKSSKSFRDSLKRGDLLILRYRVHTLTNKGVKNANNI